MSFPLTRTLARSTLSTEGDRVSGPLFFSSDPTVGETVYIDGLRTAAAITRPTTVRVHGSLRSVKRTSTLRVRAGAKPRTCATYADFQRVSADFAEPELYGDYGDYVIEFRRYRTCAKGAVLTVGFFDGDAYAKGYTK